MRVDTVDTVEPLDILRERTPEAEPPEPPEPVDVGVRISDCAVRNVPVSLVAEDNVEVGREEPGILKVDKPAWLRCAVPETPGVGRTLWGRARLWMEGASDFCVEVVDRIDVVLVVTILLKCGRPLGPEPGVGRDGDRGRSQTLGVVLESSIVSSTGSVVRRVDVDELFL